LVLTFILALSSFLIGDEFTKPNPNYEDLETAVKVIKGEDQPEHQLPKVSATHIATLALDSKAPTYGPPPVTRTASPSALFTEDFEGGAVPPAGWTADTNNYATWIINTAVPYEGSYYASCYWDSLYTGTQDEWLISPAIDLTTGGSSWRLYFWWNMSYYWGVDPYDNYDYELWISTDGGANFSTKLWSEADAGAFTSWQWYKADIDLSSYLSESNVKFGWRYYGYDGAQTNLDYVTLDTPPVGRCCYGDPMSPSCADVTQDSCTALSGHTWDELLDCTNDPCPSLPSNDDCTGAPVISSFPDTVSGTTIGATIDCPGLLDWNAVWYRFDLPYDCNNLTVDFCQTVGEIYTVGVILYDECPPDCPNYILRTGYQWVTCTSGYDNPQIWWNNMPAGSYWFPVYAVDINDDPMNFSFVVTVDSCPPAQAGDNCLDPLTVTLPAALPYTDAGQTTCGRVDDYSATCLGYYDGGEDIIYELTVTSAVNVDITLDPKGTSWTGVAIDDECPPADPCMAFSTSSGSSPHGMFGVALTAGTYYIMVDTWPSPDCISDFDLTITEAAPPPDNDDCQNAEVVTSGQTVSGTNVGATVDCPGLLDWNAVWYKFDLPYDCNYVSIDFCPTTGDIDLVGVVLYDECPPDCPSYISALADSGAVAFVDCPNGSYNPRLMWFNLQAGTYYFPAYVEDGGGGPMDFSFTINISECPCFCYEAGRCDEYIANVQVGTINNASDCGLWSDFTSISTDMLIGTGYPITITIGDAWSSDIGAVWVDWNQDCDFDDQDEQITLDVYEGYGPYTGTITPPTGAAVGSTVMKIRLQYGGTPEPCGRTSYGEVEDYGINVVSPNEPPDCNIMPSPPFTIAEGDVLNFTITALDPDAGDIVTIDATGIPAGASMTPSLPVTGPTPQSSTFNWATGPGDSGAYTVTFTVWDDEQEADTCVANITVYPNDPPECDINPPGPFNVYDGDNVTFVVTGTDPDAGDVVTITATGMPSGASMNPPLPASGPSPKSSTFSWTPSSAQTGTHTVHFTITDSHGFEALCDARITVSARPLSTLSQLGIFILIFLIVGSGILLTLRRKKATAR